MLRLDCTAQRYHLLRNNTILMLCSLIIFHFQLFSFSFLFLILQFFLSSQDKDQYGNEVQKLARPLPVEYLLVDLPTSSPLVPIYTFPARDHHFPVENRLIDGHLQDFAALHSYMQKFRSQDFLTVRTE